MSARSAAASAVPYVVVGLIAAVPLLILSAAAPGGRDPQFLEYPRGVTVFALALGMFACSRKDRLQALMVPLGTVAISCAWELVTSRGASAELVFEYSLTQLAPWVVGTIYGILAMLAIGRAGEPRSNLRRAGLWLAGVGILVIALTHANESWLTLENFGNSGTFRSSVPWPDTKKISMVAACCATALGAGLAVVSLRAPPSRLPRAIVRG